MIWTSWKSKLCLTPGALRQQPGQGGRSTGLSRRTLLRKLKSYRENEGDAAVGTLDTEQQRYYRKQTSVLVKLKYGEEWLDANLLNISLGGAAVSVHKMLSQGAPVVLRFTIPETETRAEIHGRVAWANNEGHHGIQFGEISSDTRTKPATVVPIEMKKDGWRERAGWLTIPAQF